MNRIVLGLVIFCLISVTAAAVRLPADELRVACENCVRTSDDGSRFYVNAGTPVKLTGGNFGGGTGEWFESGKSIGRGNNLQFTAAANRELTFTAGGQNKTVYVNIIESGQCLPQVGPEIVFVGDDKDKKGFIPGEVFTVKIEVNDNGCGGYHFRWGTDNAYDVLEIRNYISFQTDVYVKASPKNGEKNPTLTFAAWNDAGDRVERRLTIPIGPGGKSSLPKIELAAEVKNNEKILISRAGSSTPNENSEIKKTHVELFYNVSGGWDKISGQDYEAEEITLDASRGEGLYRIRAYVVDSRDFKSDTVDSFVRVGNAEDEAPNVYVENKTVYCKKGEPCIINAWDTYYRYRDRNGSISIDFYDEQDNRINCNEPACNLTDLKPGTYKIGVVATILGDKVRRSNKEIVTVIVTD